MCTLLHTTVGNKALLPNVQSVCFCVAGKLIHFNLGLVQITKGHSVAVYDHFALNTNTVGPVVLTENQLKWKKYKNQEKS